MATKTRTATFIRHYVEMVVVMFAGMIVLGVPGEAALHAIGSGTSELRETAPATVFLGMAFTMTVPMVAWMRYRGHWGNARAGWFPAEQSSPRGPAFQGVRWDDPSAFARSARRCTARRCVTVGACDGRETALALGSLALLGLGGFGWWRRRRRTAAG